MKPKQREPFLGILMLDTLFPRILGDAGNPESYPFPVKIIIIENTGSMDVVNDNRLPPEISNKFIDAAVALEKSGARAIISTCGFLVTEQEKIASSVKIPVIVSALSLYGKLKEDINKRKILIITASEPSLGPLTLNAANIPAEDIHIIGMEKCAAFSEVILQEKQQQSPALNTSKISDFLIEQLNYIEPNLPEIGAVLLECANLPPYIDVIHSKTQLPVYSILDGAKLIMTDN